MFDSGYFKYPQMDLVEIKGQKFIRKILTTKEERIYNTLGAKTYLLKVKKHGKYSYFPYLPQGNIAHQSKEHFKKALEAAVEFHETVDINDLLFISVTDYKLELQKTAKVVDKQLRAKVEKMLEIIERLKPKLSLVHGDYIGFNVLADGDEIRVIDWEDAEIGIGEFDVGRMLGDLYFEDPKWDNRYYDYKWHDELVEHYLKTRKNLNKEYLIDSGKQLILTGELWNYLGPIEMATKRKQTETEWYRANVKAFSEVDFT